MTFPNAPRFAITVVAASLVLVLTAAAFSSKSEAADEKRQPPRPALTVTTTVPSTSRLPVVLSANGSIAAWQEAVVGSEASGLKLAEVRVNVGDRVTKGQVLAVFAAEAVHNDVLQARANLAEAEANAADAAGNAERAKGLVGTGALSTQQINQFTTTALTAKAKAMAAKAALAAQELRLRQTRVTAPDAGLISSRTATVGAVVASGAELFKLVRQGRLEWRAEVTSSELGRVGPGTTALVTAANGTQLRGRVRTIAPTVDPQTRSAFVYVDLPAADASAPALAGMFAKGEFQLGESQALTLPQQAVVVRDGFSYVFRLNTDNRVSQIKVQTGRRLNDRIEVLRGVDDKSVVINDGAGFLNDGDVVRNASAPGGAASAPPPPPVKR